MSKTYLCDSIYITNYVSYVKEYIGCVYKAVSSPYSFKKIVVVKETKNQVLLLSKSYLFTSPVRLICSVYRIKHMLNNNVLLMRNTYFLNCNRILKNAVLLQYGNFSQFE